MNQRRAVGSILIVALLLMVPAMQARENGIYNQSSGCGCHSQTGQQQASVSISGLPSSYDANKLYQLTVSVSGGVQGSSGGFSLEVDHGTLSTGFGLMLVNVNPSGNSATHSITGSSYRSWSFEWTSPAAGTGTVTFAVAGLTSNANGADSGDRWATSTIPVPENIPVNNPPVASSVMLSPTDATTNDPLVLSYSYSDPENDPESGTEIVWYLNSQALPAGTITGTTVPTSQTQKGQQWYAEVTPSDGTNSGSTQTSNTVTIQNTPPVLTDVEITPQSPDESEDLSVSYSASDADQDSLTTTIYWYLDGVRITEFDDDTTIPSIATREGDEWRVEVMISDGDEIISKTSQVISIGGVVIPNIAPEVTSIAITPASPSTIDDLVLTYEAFDDDNDPIIDYEIEWHVDDNPTAEMDLVVNSIATQKNQIWQASVRVSDGKNWSQWAITSVTIQNSAPVVEAASIGPAIIHTDDDLVVNYQFSDLDNSDVINPSIVWIKNGIQQTIFDGLSTIPASATMKGDNWTAIVSGYDGESFSLQSVHLTALIENSLPTISLLDVPTNVSFANNDELGLAINPEFTDLDQDQIFSQILWLRNGFQEASLDNQTFVPAQYFGAGQMWTCVINFGDGDAPLQSASWNIMVDNLAPSAKISIDSANTWAGEIITLNASESHDLDGMVMNYYWQWQSTSGELMTSNGKIIDIIGNDVIAVSLTVEDDLGATAETTTMIQTTQGPSVSSLQAANEGNNVVLEWEWQGPDAEFSISRNGVEIGKVSQNEFKDKPILSGPTNYTVSPIIDGQRLVGGSATIVGFEVQNTVEQASGLSETGGLYIGLIFLLFSIAVAALGILSRRENTA